MADLPFGDGLRKVFLAGVGAIALTGEKAGDVVNQLVERGELTVAHGRDLNQELSRRASDATADVRDGLLKTRLELMSQEERANYLERVQRITEQVDAEQSARRAAHEPVSVSVSDDDDQDDDGDAAPSSCDPEAKAD